MKEKNRETKKAQISPELVAKAKAGDQAAFAELYRQTSTELYRSIHSMVHDEDLAWDIQQDTYLRVYENLGKLEHNEAFLPWLRRISVTVTATEMQKRLPVTFTDLTGEDEDQPDLPDFSIDSQPELALDRKETSRLVREILAKLPENQHLILGMRYYEDLSIQEIAEMLDTTPGAVRVHLFRGRKKVETAVRELEKQGVKLYGLSPLPFLIALMKQQAAPVQEAEAVLAKTLTKAGLTAGAKTAALAAGSSGAAAAEVAEVAVLHATRPFFTTVLGKVVLGVICAGVVVGGAAGYRWAKNSLFEKSNPIPYADTDENLRTNPTAPTLPVEIVTTGEAEIEISRPLDTEPAELTGSPEFTPGSDEFSGTCGKHLTWRFDPETGLLTIEGRGAMDDLLQKGNPWQNFCEAITAVSLPEGLTNINKCAFSFCDSLTSVTIPDGVTGIGEMAFLDCSSLTSVTIPNSVTSIGQSAFSGCSALTNVTIPDNVTRIGASAFESCDSLTIVTIPDSVTRIGASAFESCDSLTIVTIPDSVTKIDKDAFIDCIALTAIQVSSGNPNYSSLDGVLFNKSKTELLRYPAGKKETSYAIPDSATCISKQAFSACIFLTSVTIPDSMTSISDSAFSNCNALTSVTIPDSVTRIGKSAFIFCNSLTSVTIPDGVTSIGDSAFECCNSLTSVTIPDGVTSIGNYAFFSCSTLTSVTIPDGVASIGSCAFFTCPALTSVTIPNSVTFIGNLAFGWNYVNDTPEEQIDGFTIYGAEGSEAERYAKENGFRFVPVS